MFSVAYKISLSIILVYNYLFYNYLIQTYARLKPSFGVKVQPGLHSLLSNIHLLMWIPYLYFYTFTCLQIHKLNIFKYLHERVLFIIATTLLGLFFYTFQTDILYEFSSPVQRSLNEQYDLIKV
jgi:hypothetical protein